LRCSECVLKRQRDDGAWVYPNPEWRGRIATAEGTWGAIGLLESYRQTSSARFLQGACMWADFVTREIGFQRAGDTLAVNYFHGRRGARVPNNSAFVARFFAELADVTGRKHSLGPCAGLVEFLRAVQNDAGEFPYTVPGENGEKPTPHFQCYQYNAFQCLDLMRYHDVTKDRSVLPLVVRVLGFLRMGLASDGHSYFACGSRSRTVTYHTAVLAKAFARAEELNILNDDELADRAYSYLVNVQQPDGSFPFSRGDYLLLRDTRSYPRNLAMILYHLLPGECGGA